MVRKGAPSWLDLRGRDESTPVDLAALGVEADGYEKKEASTPDSLLFGAFSTGSIFFGGEKGSCSTAGVRGLLYRRRGSGGENRSVRLWNPNADATVGRCLVLFVDSLSSCSVCQASSNLLRASDELRRICEWLICNASRMCAGIEEPSLRWQFSNRD